MAEVVIVVLAVNDGIIDHAVVQTDPTHNVRHGLPQAVEVLFGDGLRGRIGLHLQIRGRERGLGHPFVGLIGGRGGLRRGGGLRQDGRQQGQTDLLIVGGGSAALGQSGIEIIQRMLLVKLGQRQCAQHQRGQNQRRQKKNKQGAASAPLVFSVFRVSAAH